MNLRERLGPDVTSLEDVRALLAVPRPASIRSMASLEVQLRYVGFHCFGETDESSSSDEPFVILGVVPAALSHKRVVGPKRYEDVDSGESIQDLEVVYQGPPLGATVSVTLGEHDQGNPETFKENVERAVDVAADRIIEGLALVPAVGPALAIAGEVALVLGGPALVESLNDLLGTEDDLVGSTSLTLTARDMRRLSHAPRGRFEGIDAHVETPLISGEGASYKLYFDVRTVI